MKILPVSVCKSVCDCEMNRKNCTVFRKDSVSFQAKPDMIDALAGLRVSSGKQKGFWKAGSVLKYKKMALDIIKNAENYEDRLPFFLLELGKMPNNADKYKYYKSWLLWRSDTISLENIKRNVLSNIFPKLSDSNSSHRYAKTTFLLSLFKRGEYLTGEFYDVFKSLPSKYYKDFKVCLANSILYSDDEKTKFQRAYDINLLSTLLDENVYGEYSSKFKKGIRTNKKIICKSIITDYKKNKNLAFLHYVSDFKDDKDDLTSISSYKQELFSTMVKNTKQNEQKLAKKLNMDSSLAQIVIDDYRTLEEVERTDDLALKKKLFSKRIKDKLAQEIAPDIFVKPSERLRIYIDSIKSFMNKSGALKPELEEEFDYSLYFLKDKFLKAMEFENSEAERNCKSYTDRINHIMNED